MIEAVKDKLVVTVTEHETYHKNDYPDNFILEINRVSTGLCGGKHTYSSTWEDVPSNNDRSCVTIYNNTMYCHVPSTVLVEGGHVPVLGQEPECVKCLTSICAILARIRSGDKKELVIDD